MIAAVFLTMLAIYLVCGLALAIPFVLAGVKQIDPHAAHGSWGFRLLSLSIRREAAGIRISWPAMLEGWRLQERKSLSPANWADSPSGTNNPIVISLGASGMKFYLL